MKNIKIFYFIFSIIFLVSCTYEKYEMRRDIERIDYSLERIIENYDLWYIDINKTRGNSTIPFLEKAFTISFVNGTIYANNNIVNIGKTGNGLGIKIANYNTYRGILEIINLNNTYDFSITKISNNEIILNDLDANVSYFLMGNMTRYFDYDRLFSDNIEYFLQEYAAWERVDIKNGIPNMFDQEHYLEFTPNRNNIFRSSGDDFKLRINNIKWDYQGGYLIEDYRNTNVKRLSLLYNNNDIEKFDLKVISEDTIVLIHLKTKTRYTYTGLGFIQYLRASKGNKPRKKTRLATRKRKKDKRNIIKK